MSRAPAPCGDGVAVVGAGITGLAAAFELLRAGVEVVVLEASDRCGGKVDGSAVGGLAVDSGPDGFLARDPEAAGLCRRLGLGADLVASEPVGASVWADGRLRPLPGQSVLGAPFSADAVRGAGIVSAEGEAALRRGLAQEMPPLHGDASVGEVLRPRLGDEVLERLVDPLLGGINAGSADRLSIEACAPPLFAAARRGGPFGPALRGVAAERAAGAGEPAPRTLFQSVRGGTARIVRALAAQLGDAVRLGEPVKSLRRDALAGRGGGWTLETPRGLLRAGGVILAAPAWETARLLAAHSPEAAHILGDIEYSDVVLVTLVLSSGQAPHRMDGSGFVVPRREGLLMTACSWSSSKWAHYRREDTVVLRVSAGRTDDRRWLDLDRAGLVAVLAEELALTGVITDDAVSEIVGAHGDDAARCGSGRPAAKWPDTLEGRRHGAGAAHGGSGLLPAVRVTPWRRSLPQYRPGHLARVGTIEACLAAEAPGVVAAGAALRGLGLPACIRQAQAAAAALTGDHAERAEAQPDQALPDEALPDDALLEQAAATMPP